MKITIDIPQDFEEHFNQDKFKDSMGRIAADIIFQVYSEDSVSGNYEIELLEMLSGAFETAETKESTEALNKLKDKLNQAYSDAVNDAQGYWNPNVAQDALQDAYDNVLCWIYEIFNGSEDSEKHETN